MRRSWQKCPSRKRSSEVGRGFLYDSQVEKFDAVMVLGKELRRDPERARRELAARSAAAAVAYRRGAERVFVLEDVLRGQQHAGSQIVRECLLGLGVPERALDLDRVTRSTRGEAIEAAKRMERLGFRRLLVLTSAYHVPRARSYFWDLLGREQVSVRTPSYALRYATEEERAIIANAELSDEDWAYEQRVEARLSRAARFLGLLPASLAWKIEREVGRLYRRPT